MVGRLDVHLLDEPGVFLNVGEAFFRLLAHQGFHELVGGAVTVAFNRTGTDPQRSSPSRAASSARADLHTLGLRLLREPESERPRGETQALEHLHATMTL